MSKGNPLGIAGDAYRSGNIPLAAAVTITVNFLLGSLASITVPSILVPDWVRFWRASSQLLGACFCVSMQTLALGMLPHSLTMLLEGEGYILAAIFGLMIPIHVVSRGLGGNLFTRFGPLSLAQSQSGDLDRTRPGRCRDLRGHGSYLDE